MSKILAIQVPIPYPVKWVNCYYIQDSTPTLIDTGLNAQDCLEKIKEAVEHAGGTLRGLERIIATHGHVDHVGLAGKLAEISGAEVFVHPWECIELLAGPGAGLSPIEHWVTNFMSEAGAPEEVRSEMTEILHQRFRTMLSPLTAESAMEDGDTFTFDDFRLQVIHSPGHSPGSICLFDAENAIRRRVFVKLNRVDVSVP